MRLVLECSLPFLLMVAAYFGIFLLDVRRPAARALGCILPRLCVVSSEEIQGYCALVQSEDLAGSHLRREMRWNQIHVTWMYLRAMVWNTRLFQQVARFEKVKIDPSKSSLDYEPRETLILALVDECLETRKVLVKAQVGLIVRATLGLRLDQSVLMTLLGQYKHLEQEIITLAGMAEDDCYQKMLVERLGLGGWGLIEGGGPSPA